MKGFERYFFTYKDPYPNITRTFFNLILIFGENNKVKDNPYSFKNKCVEGFFKN